MSPNVSHVMLAITMTKPSYQGDLSHVL